jgi:glycosyltransferase involved in cell wall biosynthesis
MIKADLLYISTNNMWSGSEELWLSSASEFEKEGLVVAYATKYDHPKLKLLKGTGFNSNMRKGNTSNLFTRIMKFSRGSVNPLHAFIKGVGAKLVVISQGNNVDSLSLMKFCLQNSIPYLTITQLVTTTHFLSINKHNLSQFQQVYSKALKNCFVSANNLLVNNLMLGIKLQNAIVVNNPCRNFDEGVLTFPKINDSYQVGLVGRIECYHKGYDLLLQVLSQEKWLQRNIQFNIYGDGPHIEIIRSNIEILSLKNIVLKGFVDNIRSIWEHNHLLCMPSRMEGQALSLIEAMSYGRAAVVTNVGGAKELIEDDVNGFLADAAAVKSIDDALETAWNNRERWESMGVSARATIAKIYTVKAETQLNEEIEGCLINLN